ncbi:hypothetical protein IWQ61_009894 [Dispira simplex]|nr:hypothetical protein IWQ61_009894 [Dispira simplex]
MTNPPSHTAAFTFPPIYDFPPFYTRQPTQSTWRDQVQQWDALVRAYCQHHRIFQLDLSSAIQSDLFHNSTIDRKVSQIMAREILQYMVDQGHAEWLDDRRTAPTQCFIYWRSPDDWANMVYGWATENGQMNTVFTLYELVHDDLTVGADFHGMDMTLLKKAITLLSQQGKAQLFHNETENLNSLGVKFY